MAGRELTYVNRSVSWSCCPEYYSEHLVFNSTCFNLVDSKAYRGLRENTSYNFLPSLLFLKAEKVVQVVHLHLPLSLGFLGLDIKAL